jgi:allantoinase
VLTEVDLLVTGGTLVTEHDELQAGVAVRAGRVAGIVEPGATVPRAGQVLDARGLHVLPGAVDCHVHFNEPGRTHWEGYATGSAAAAAGGITTVLDMPLNCDPPTVHAEALALKQRAVASRSIVDYGHWGGLVADNLDDLAALHAGGVVGYKAFMSPSGLDEYPAVDDAVLLEGMRRVAGLGGILALHAESHRLTAALAVQSQANGRREPLAWARARPPIAEEEAVRRALLLARETGARVHFVHLSTPAAAQLVAAARRAGVAASAETCPHYLALNEGDLERLGPIAKCAPPLRSREIVEALWQALLDGEIDCIASDHSPCPPEDKERGRDDIWRAWGGIAGVQTLLPVLLTEGVLRRRLSLTRLARLTSANPARLFGLYPRKGALRIGADADLVLVDLEREWTLTAEQLLTRWPVSPFVGRAFRGWVVATLVRGVVVYRDGQVLAQPGHGRLVRPGHGACPRQQEVSR